MTSVGRRTKLAFALVIIVSIPIVIPPLFSTLLNNPQDWHDETEGIIKVEKGVAEITSVNIPKKVFEIADAATLEIEIKNTGDVESTFYARCTLEPPGPSDKYYLIPDERFPIKVGESLKKDLLWVIPEDASPGTYTLVVALYDASPDAPQVNLLDHEIVAPALMVEGSVSFLQVSTFSIIGTEHRAIHIHIAEKDVVRSGTWTFLFLTYALQFATIFIPIGAGGSFDKMLKLPEWLVKFGNELGSLWKLEKASSLLSKVIDLKDGKSIDLLFWQVVGQVGVLFEARMVDVVVGIGIPPTFPLDIVAVLPKEYMELPAPSFLELSFDSAILGFYNEIEEYFPLWRFSKDEQYYPCSFYFDNDCNLTNNRDNYDSAARNGIRPPYCAYIHTVFDADYVTIQYWLYYVYNQHTDWAGLLDHKEDWDSRVYIIFKRDDLNTPAKVGFLSHFWSGMVDWKDPSLEKDGTHVVAYVAEGSHGSYSSPAGMSILSSSLIFFDEFKTGGIALGSENITNWVVIGKEIEEIELGDLGYYCLLEHDTIKGEHPAPPLSTKDGKEYWPKEFSPQVKAPWHQDDTWPERVLLPLNALNVIVYSPVDICVKDSSGRVAGTDEKNQTRLEIPGALYTGSASEPEIIIVPGASGEYEVYVHGTTNGTFDLQISRYSEGQVSSVMNSSDTNIQENDTKEYDFLYPSLVNLIVEKEPYNLVMESNSTISGFYFDQSFNQVDFDVLGTSGTMGFCNVTLPRSLTTSLWGDNFNVTVDNQPPLSITKTENDTHVFIYFTYAHSVHEVAILGLRPDITPPFISVLSPEQGIYSKRDVPLVFTVSESTSWIGYSLNEQASVTLAQNTTLVNLTDGTCGVVVYASDNAGNMGSSNTTHFTVDGTSPDITNVYQIPPETNVSAEDEVNISATVTDVTSGVRQVTLSYTTGNGTWFNETMSNLAGDRYNGTIPKFLYGTMITYVLIAEDKANNTITTQQMEDNYQYPVTPELPAGSMILLFIVATLPAVIIYRRRRLLRVRS